MRKVLFITAALLTLVFFGSQTYTSAQIKRKSQKKIYSISQIQQEAESEARYLWGDRINRCGTDYYTQDGDYVYQFKNTRVTVSQNSLSPADKLNGVEFAGYTYFTVGQSRSVSTSSTNYQNGVWSRWYDGLRMPKGGSRTLFMSLRKETGVWEAEPYSSNPVYNLEPVNCSDVYADSYYRYYDYDRNRNDSRTSVYTYPNNPNSSSTNRNNPNTVSPNNRNNETITWVRSSSNQNMPYNAIVGGVESSAGTNGKILYVCRADYNGGTHPGKLSGGTCNIGYGGREIVLSTYEVATGNGYWGKPQSNYSNALVGGRETDRTLYVCRANYRESNGGGYISYGQYPGKVVDGKCNFGFASKEVSTSDFEVFYPNTNYSTFEMVR